ncbi:TetR family transcriptional regulator [Kribbella antiqua]|uniref:TetR family transcriptional regulator n=1 Tax=Kribbella antiqua TaxID=2512217 RepID=A0A4R2J2J6_9ACTN|nr:TetR/AcrR family transcriptional regulator [Kribbella antiqua]TCO51156.1 TetR family transcriptional regulator [Kribbella antiqua]
MERRRGAELEAGLLDAAWDELMESGYSALTMEAVAARAKTGKQVLYRRWKNRAELVLAAMRHRTGSITDDVPDTGSLRSDVLAVLQRMADRFESIGPDVIHGLLAEAPDLDPEVFTRMSPVMATIVRRAAARGEIPTADLPARVLTAPANLLRHEMLLTRGPLSEETLTSLVDDVFLPLVT